MKEDPDRSFEIFNTRITRTKEELVHYEVEAEQKLNKAQANADFFR